MYCLNETCEYNVLLTQTDVFFLGGGAYKRHNFFLFRKYIWHELVISGTIAW